MYPHKELEKIYNVCKELLQRVEKLENTINELSNKIILSPADTTSPPLPGWEPIHVRPGYITVEKIISPRPGGIKWEDICKGNGPADKVYFEVDVENLCKFIKIPENE